MERIIFETVHGSRLYGFEHEESDTDIFYVTTSTEVKNKHFRSRAGYDVVSAGLDSFLDKARSGSHQSVEALFSPVKVWHDTKYKPLINLTFVQGAEVFTKYERTIKKFCYGDFKRRRHAYRLAVNLNELRRGGWMSPCLTEAHVEEANHLASIYTGAKLLDKIWEVLGNKYP